jgi:hypothetical protein
MFSFERKWAVLVLSSFAGANEGFTVRQDEVDYLAGLQIFLRAGSEKAGLGVRVAIAMAMIAPLWAWGRFCTMRSLSATERSELLAALLKHRFFAVRELCLLLKVIACMAIFRSMSALARSGYDRPAGRISLPVEAA